MKELLTKAGNALLELAERINEVSESKNVKPKMKAPEIGEEIEIAGHKWKVLEKTSEGYKCLAESIGNRQFGKNNNWTESSIRKELKDLAEKIEKEIGVELPSMSRNLISMDGQKEYGTCMDKVSILTFDEYRRYRSLIPNYNKWWWLITPWSTKCNNDTDWITVVSPSGSIDDGNCNGNGGVRPFCIFPSSIFESGEE